MYGNEKGELTSVSGNLSLPSHGERSLKTTQPPFQNAAKCMLYRNDTSNSRSDLRCLVLFTNKPIATSLEIIVMSVGDAGVFSYIIAIAVLAESVWNFPETL